MAAINSFYQQFKSHPISQNLMDMSDKPVKRYLFASDFDHTLTFNDSGYVLSELLGISTEEFEHKSAGMADLNFVQQGAELAYLLLHDPKFRECVRREHLHEVGRRIRLKQNIQLLSKILATAIDGYHFDFYVLSAAPVEVVQAALEGIVPADHIFGTRFRYTPSGEIETIVRATAGYGKVAVLERLQKDLQISPDRVVYVGDGSSDLHVMLHVNLHDGFTIAVSDARHVAQIAKRTILGGNALASLLPIFEDIVGWDRLAIRAFFESYGFLIQEWESVRKDWLTLRAITDESQAAAQGS
jgi:phosphoserine phosphatase